MSHPTSFYISCSYLCFSGTLLTPIQSLINLDNGGFVFLPYETMQFFNARTLFGIYIPDTNCSVFFFVNEN